MKKILPLGKNILIKPAEADKMTESGIILPDKSESEKSQQGKVISVGDSKKIDSKLKSGAQVIFEKYEGSEVEIDGSKFIIIESKKVLAIIE
ncbi:MAG: co-chaperone GroES [Candidatus Moranbacteria bacterium]|nr:co-chaperone GroES [Candidatus Moranbacteria bacterium]